MNMRLRKNCVSAETCEALTATGLVANIYPNATTNAGDMVLLECDSQTGPHYNKTLFCAYNNSSDTFRLQGDAPHCPGNLLCTFCCSALLGTFFRGNILSSMCCGASYVDSVVVVPSEVLYFVLSCYVLSLVEPLQAELFDTSTFDTSTECVLLQYPSCYILIYSLL